MRTKIFLLLILLLFLNSCGTKLKTVIVTERPPLAYDEEVYVIPINEKVPDGAKSVGKLSIGDSGFTTKCNYETVLEQAKLKARESGANIVKLLEHKKPNPLWSTCHRMKVEFYYQDNFSNLGANKSKTK